MTFTIFKKTGEVYFDHNGYEDYDGDTGRNVEIEIADERVKRDTAEFIYRDYIRNGVSRIGVIPSEIEKELITRVGLILTDMEAWECAVSEYECDLINKYAEEYNRG